jgi:hypothetical protein
MVGGRPWRYTLCCLDAKESFYELRPLL